MVIGTQGSSSPTPCNAGIPHQAQTLQLARKVQKGSRAEVLGLLNCLGLDASGPLRDCVLGLTLDSILIAGLQTWLLGLTLDCVS